MFSSTQWHLGTMGFGYKQWLGPFYPAGMAPKNYLAHYSTLFDAVEIDSTFYGTPRPESVVRWRQSTTDHFTFCLKTPKAITHEARLTDGIEAMAEFVETAVLLQEKLGCILIQFGPAFTYAQVEELRQFLSQLPPTARYAVEFRHESWVRPEVVDLLRPFNICLTATDYIHLPKTITPTADFLYLRFIGPHGQYATKDKELVDKTADLQAWYAQIKPLLPQFQHIFGFFNNDYSGFSPKTCNRFKQIVGLDVGEIRPLQQGRLF
ncbi:MAG: DUF72 domain-containing protein [Anaerolineales bacterium]|nr:DUF72 domain-containing protein [Anaerolineales bacterium]MCB8937988.1 DUF72 domain-containing protein [Ardenticatenaceae bacterium]